MDEAMRRLEREVLERSGDARALERYVLARIREASNRFVFLSVFADPVKRFRLPMAGERSANDAWFRGNDPVVLGPIVDAPIHLDNTTSRRLELEFAANGNYFYNPTARDGPGGNVMPSPVDRDGTLSIRIFDADEMGSSIAWMQPVDTGPPTFDCPDCHGRSWRRVGVASAGAPRRAWVCRSCIRDEPT